MPGLVIIPTYNERDNVADIIAAVRRQPCDLHVLIVDDGSPDGTAAIVRRLQDAGDAALFLMERPGKMGLGTAYLAGFQWALERGYEHVFEMDADFSHNPDDLPRLLEACQEGADLAIGSRYISGVNVVNWPMGRVLMSYFASVYVRCVTGMRIMDTTAGFKCYRAATLRAMRLDEVRLKGYGFQIEMKYTAHQLGFRIVEVPIIFTDRKKGQSKMSGGIFSEAVLGVLTMRLRSLVHPYKRRQ